MVFVFFLLNIKNSKYLVFLYSTKSNLLMPTNMTKVNLLITNLF